MIDADMNINHNMPIFKQLPSEEDFQTEMTAYLNKNLADLPIPETSQEFDFTLYVANASSRTINCCADTDAEFRGILKQDLRRIPHQIMKREPGMDGINL